MARRSGTRKSQFRQNATFQFPSVARRMPVRPVRLHQVRVELRPVEDRRRFHPLGYHRPARSVTGHPVKPLVIGKAVVARPARRPAARSVHVPGPSPVVRFAAPKRTIICVRRKRRREVLMALGRGNGRARKRRNWFSEVSCR